MRAIEVALVLLLAVVLSGFVARLVRLPLPLVQLGLGAAVHHAGLASAVLDPALFFLLFLPPLLFLDGWRLPQDALRRDAATMLRLALGLVVFTVLGMGWFIHWLIPALPLAVAFALAGVIAPTDPVALSSITARDPVPPRLMHILQGESLLNDASGLVCMRFAVAAALTGSFSPGAALLSFLWVALGGLAVGAGITWAVARLAAAASARGLHDGGAQILVTLLLPFGVYLLAERLGCSGILAAVAAGITLNLSDIWPWRAATRLQRTAVWDMVQLAANGSIFVLLGQQLPALLAAAPVTVLVTGHRSPWWLVLQVGVIVLALAALRFAWVWVAFEVRFLGARRRGEPAPLHGWRVVGVASLAGVRGAVTLAGVLTLPLALADGSPFPGRDLAILLAAGVIVLSLLLATALLPVLLPRLVQGPDGLPRAAPQALEDATRRAAAEAGLQATLAVRATLGEGALATPSYDAVEDRLVALYRQRIARHRSSAPALRRADRAVERRLRLAGLRAERTELLRYGRSHGLDELLLRRIARELDFEEARYGV